MLAPANHSQIPASAGAGWMTSLEVGPANAVPQTPGFVLRARLIQFDTENSVRGAKGFVFAALTQAKAGIS